MNTQENNYVYTYDASELAKNSIEMIDRIEAWSNNAELRFTRPDIKEKGLFSKNLKSEIGNASKSTKKKINKSLSVLEKNMSLRSANLFLHTLGKVYGESIPKIKLPLIEEKISLSKAKWKAAQKIAEDAMKEYKEMKKDSDGNPILPTLYSKRS